MKKDAFIEILKLELSRKKARNKAYSLRSFSRDLEIDASNLSKILSHQKTLGPALKLKLARKIGLSDEDLESINSRASANTGDQNYAHHELQTFELISEWQHYAILELLKVNGFKPSPKTIAKRLGLSLQETKLSLERLKNAGLLRIENGTFIASETSSSSILTTATSKAHRDQQKQILEGAIDALEKTPIELRSQSSMTFAIDTQKLDAARALIKKFRRDLGRLLSEDIEVDEVYQLSVSLYPVSINKESL